MKALYKCSPFTIYLCVSHRPFHIFHWVPLVFINVLVWTPGDGAGDGEEAPGARLRPAAVAGGRGHHDHRLRDVPEPHTGPEHQEQEAQGDLPEDSGGSRYVFVCACACACVLAVLLFVLHLHFVSMCVTNQTKGVFETIKLNYLQCDGRNAQILLPCSCLD